MESWKGNAGRLGALMVACLTLTGCVDLNAMLEKYHAGTLKGYGYCRSHILKQGVSETTIQDLCAQRHSREVFRAPKIAAIRDLYAAYLWLGVDGYLLNETKEIIFTSLTVELRPAAPNLGAIRHVIQPLWLEPGNTVRLLIPASESGIKISQRPTTTYSSAVISARGIEVPLK